MREKEFQLKVISWLNRHHITHIKIHGGKIYFPKRNVVYMGDGEYDGVFYALKLKSGFSDLIIFYNGETIFLELKLDNNRLQKDQKEMFFKLNENGFDGNCFMIKPKDWENFKLNYRMTNDLKKTLVNSLGINNWMTKKEILEYNKKKEEENEWK